MTKLQMIPTNQNKGKAMNTTKIYCPNCDHLFTIDEAIAHLINKGKKNSDLELEKIYEKKYEEKFNQEKENIRRDAERKDSSENIELKSKVILLEQQNEKYSKDRIEKNKLEIENNKLSKEKNELESRVTLELEKKYGEEAKIKLEQNDRQWEIKLEQERIKQKKAKEKNKEQAEILDQGSIQEQGEGQERVLEKFLINKFPNDEIIPIPGGVEGADVLQKIFHYGKFIGTLCIESKKTKRFDTKWINKLKKDQKDTSSDLGIIVTKTLPKDLTKGGHKDGVWIYDFYHFDTAIEILRKLIIKTKVSSQLNENFKDKSSKVYKYLIGSDFKNTFDAIFSTVTNMHDQIKKKSSARKLELAKELKNANDLEDNLIDFVAEVDQVSNIKVIPKAKIRELVDNRKVKKSKNERKV